MSYHSHVDMTVSGNLEPYFKEADAASILEQVRVAVAALKCVDVEDFVDRAAAMLRGERVILNHWYAEYAEALLLHLSRAFPGTTFGMRGMGEEFDDVWARGARDGHVFRSWPKPPPPNAV
jgi:hypothetical protein